MKSVVANDVMDAIKKVFVKLDEYDDMIVDFQELVNIILNEDLLRRYDDKPVFYIEALNCEVKVKEILQYLSDEASNRGIDRFISWREFEQYFTVLREGLLKYINSNNENDNQASPELEIEPSYLMIIKDVFDSVSRELGGRDN